MAQTGRKPMVAMPAAEDSVFLGDADIEIPLGRAFSRAFRPVPLGMAAVMPTMELSF